MDKPPKTLSFDVYPGLDLALDEALARHSGHIAASAPEPDDLGAAADAAMEQSTFEEVDLPIAVEAWAKPQINDMGVGLHSWYVIREQLGVSPREVPSRLSELLNASPNLIPTLTRLYEAKVALDNSGEQTPGGRNVGHDMRLVVIPWQIFRQNLDDLPVFVAKIRQAQGVETNEKFVSDILNAIENDRPIYRTEDGLVSARDYLDMKIEHDGPWGVMLIQSTADVGLKSLTEGDDVDERRSPSYLTDNGRTAFEVAGVKVDALGIFEALSLGIEQDVTRFKGVDPSWLLANRLQEDLPHIAHVPWNGWLKDELIWSHDFADFGGSGIRHRLAVA